MTLKKHCSLLHNLNHPSFLYRGPTQALQNILEQDGSIPVPTLLDWGIELCEILEFLHCHEPALVQQCLSPGSILLGQDGHLHLADLGGLLILGQEAALAFTTRGFSAPEHYAGTYDLRTEVFAVGMLLHYLATGIHPGLPPYEVRPIRKIDSNLPASLEKIILRCTAMDPTRRYSSCTQLKKDLLRIRKGGLTTWFRASKHG